MIAIEILKSNTNKYIKMNLGDGVFLNYKLSSLNLEDKKDILAAVKEDCFFCVPSKEEHPKLEDLSDGEIIHIAEQMGMEECIIKDCEGGLVNREELIKEIGEGD